MGQAKILALFTGGTITMMKSADDTLKPSQNLPQIQKFFLDLNKIAHITTQDVFNVDSSNMNPDMWVKLAQVIYDNYANYDGFVITHGTDTLAYTATALSFALQGLNKPVILTGAQKPISELGSDSPFNINNSFQVAVSGKLREVAIVFDTKIMRGNRCSKKHAKKIDAFWSPQFPVLGEIGVEIRYFHHLLVPNRKKLKLCAGFDHQIVSLNLFPGFTPEIFDAIIGRTWCHGIILRGFGGGNIPTNQTVIPYIEKAITSEVPVVLMSPCPGGTTYLQAYETGKRALEAGVISAQDMTWESATVKLMWVLAQTRDMKKIRELMSHNIAGELSLT